MPIQIRYDTGTIAPMGEIAYQTGYGRLRLLREQQAQQRAAQQAELAQRLEIEEDRRSFEREKLVAEDKWRQKGYDVSLAELKARKEMEEKAQQRTFDFQERLKNAEIDARKLEAEGRFKEAQQLREMDHVTAFKKEEAERKFKIAQAQAANLILPAEVQFQRIEKELRAMEQDEVTGDSRYQDLLKKRDMILSEPKNQKQEQPKFFRYNRETGVMVPGTSTDPNEPTYTIDSKGVPKELEITKDVRKKDIAQMKVDADARAKEEIRKETVEKNLQTRRDNWEKRVDTRAQFLEIQADKKGESLSHEDARRQAEADLWTSNPDIQGTESILRAEPSAPSEPTQQRQAPMPALVRELEADKRAQIRAQASTRLEQIQKESLTASPAKQALLQDEVQKILESLKGQ